MERGQTPPATLINSLGSNSVIRCLRRILLGDGP
jgi:hypothetical protein